MRRLAFSIFLVVWSIHPLFAGIRVEKVQAGLDSYIRNERWLPVVFDLRSDGNFQGSIEVVRGTTVFRKSVDLGQHSIRRVEILIYQSGYGEPLTYRILDDSGSVVIENKVDIRPLNYQDNLLLVISDTEYNHQFLNGIQNPWGGKTFVAYLRSADLFSDPIALSSADAVAIGDVSLSTLQPVARDTLLLYAASGGVLVLSSATNHTVILDPALRSALPYIAPELTQLSRGDFLVSRWSAKTTDSFPSFSLPAQEVRPSPSDHVLVALTPGLSLVTSSTFYKGNLLYFAFDYTRMPEETRTIFAGYWNDLVFRTSSGPPAFGKPFRQRPEDNPRAQQFLYNIPGLRLPDVKWFALFFFVYLIAVGPMQYFILNRLKKNALVWTTFPLIILMFTAGAIGYSKYRRSGSGAIRHVQILEAFPGLRAQTRYQGFGTAMASSGTFSFQAVPDHSYMTKTAKQAFTYLPEPFVFSENLPHSIIGENVKTWAYRTLDAISTEPISVPVQVSVSIDGSTLYGTAKNAGNAPIENAFFLYDNRNVASIGSIEAGASRKFSVELNNKTAAPMAENHLRGLLDLYSLSLTGPHFFMGEIRGEPGEIVINGKRLKTECLQYVAVYLNLHEAGPSNTWQPYAYNTPVYR